MKGLRTLQILSIFASLLRWRSCIGFGVLPPPSTRQVGTSSRHIALYVGSMDDDAQKMLEKARKLREEAEGMESKLRAERGSTVEAAGPEPAEKAIKFQEMPGSTWSITYRFADEPVKDRDDDAEPLEFFRGQVNLLFRPDGYTEVISGEENANDLKLVKIWGWDEELSQEDGKKYVLFSMDAITPTNQQKQRFYFQALLEQERDEIFLREGTVTIKRAQGIQGILAQFRYVGDFTAKPIKA